jgi:glycosyltransferase involved in cell wall biosynthesis
VRVLFVVHRYWPALGGAERHYRALAERIAAEGHRVQVYTTDALELQRFWDRRRARVAVVAEAKNGVAIRRFRVRHLPFHVRVLDALTRALPLRAVQLRWRPPSPLVPGLARTASGDWDVVVAGALPVNSILHAAYRLARRSRSRLVYLPFCHLGAAPGDAVARSYATPAQIWLLRQADAVIALTDRERHHLMARGVAPERLTVVPAGVDPDAVAGGDGARFRDRHGIDGPIVAYVGANAYDKGTAHLVQAMARLWAVGEKATLMLAGEPFADFERSLERQGPLPRLRRLGRIDEAEKRDLLAAAHVIAMPSRTDGFGQLFLEAWCYGLPVIGADAGGIPEVVRDGENGYLVPFGDVAALASRLHALLSDPGLAARFGDSGRRQTLACWTWDAVYAQTRPSILSAPGS